MLTVGAHQQSTEAIALLAAEGGQRRIQWLAEGLGAIALGPPRGSLEWWMVGAACGARSWLGGITPELATLPLDKGRWRESAGSTLVRKCLNDEVAARAPPTRDSRAGPCGSSTGVASDAKKVLKGTACRAACPTPGIS